MYGHELCNHLLCNVCLYNKTKITVPIKSGKRSRVKNQSFKARHVDVTAKFSTSLNSSINRDEDLEKIEESRHTSKGQYSVQKRRKKTSTT